MLKDLGLPINQEGMTERQKPLDELKDDIIKLCNYIERNKGRKIISLDDINNCGWCLTAQTYHRIFKRDMGISLTDFIKSLGFETNKPGMGIVHKFEDGEIATSKYEFMTSVFFKDNSMPYIRNVPYKDFIPEYHKNKDCDYVMERNNITWYIEIAGMLDYRKTSKKYDDKIRKKYKKDLAMKEQMLKDNNLNYRIIYPEDFRTKSLEEIFSFLFT